MTVFLEKVFFSTLIVRFFAEKQKIFKFGKIRKFDGERVFFEKKRSRPFQRHL